MWTTRYLYSALLAPLAFSLLTVGCSGSSAETTTAAPPKDVKELAHRSLAEIDGTLKLSGLKQPVQVVRDEWGVPHIYAQNTDDLFFAQGYVMAEDRLWEMEWWRRELEGRVAEVLGPSAFERDRLARLLKFRGPFDDAEWTSYHKNGKEILTAYANGINAYITTHADRLPVEFVLTGIKPLPWTAETVVLREPAFGDAVSELRLAMNVVEVRRQGSQPPRGARPVGRASGARGARRQARYRCGDRRHAGHRPAPAPGDRRRVSRTACRAR